MKLRFPTMPWRHDLMCQQVAELLTAYLDGALPKRQHAALEAHLMKCVECTEYLAQFRRSIALSGSIPDDPVPTELLDVLDGVFNTKFGRGDGGGGTDAAS